MHLYEGSGHYVKLLLNGNILTLGEKKVLCSAHEGEQLPHCWAHITRADHIVTVHVVITLISSITVLEVRTKSTNYTQSPTTETIL